MDWLMGNWGTIVVGLVVLGIACAALRSVQKDLDAGNCAGCGGCSGKCGGCCRRTIQNGQ